MDKFTIIMNCVVYRATRLLSTGVFLMLQKYISHKKKYSYFLEKYFLQKKKRIAANVFKNLTVKTVLIHQIYSSIFDVILNIFKYFFHDEIQLTSSSILCKLI